MIIYILEVYIVLFSKMLQLLILYNSCNLYKHDWFIKLIEKLR